MRTQKQAQRQSVNVKVVIGEKRKPRRPRRPTKRHIMQPYHTVVPVIQQHHLINQSQWHPLPAPQVQQSSTGYTMQQQPTQRWDAGVQTTQEHPFASVQTNPIYEETPFSTPAPAPPPAPSVTPMEAEITPISGVKRAREDLASRSKSELLTLAAQISSSRGLQVLSKEQLVDVITSEQPESSANALKKMKRLRITH